MQIFISINDGDIIFTNQILNRADPLSLRLVEDNSISRKYFTTQRRSPWGNHWIKSINTEASMVINKRLKVGSFTVKNTNRNGKTAHSDPTIQNKITTNAKKNLSSHSLLTDVPQKKQTTCQKFFG